MSSKPDVDALKLLKVDLLALGMLSCLRRGFDLLRRYHRLDLDLAGVPRDCGKTYEMLRRADGLGVFQVESRAQMNMLPRLRPSKFYDLVVQVALVEHVWAIRRYCRATRYGAQSPDQRDRNARCRKVAIFAND